MAFLVSLLGTRGQGPVPVSLEKHFEVNPKNWTENFFFKWNNAIFAK